MMPETGKMKPFAWLILRAVHVQGTSARNIPSLLAGRNRNPRIDGEPDSGEICDSVRPQCRRVEETHSVVRNTIGHMCCVVVVHIHAESHDACGLALGRQEEGGGPRRDYVCRSMKRHAREMIKFVHEGRNSENCSPRASSQQEQHRPPPHNDPSW